MKNRKRLVEILKAGVSDKLQSELDYFLEEEREYAYDLADALNDADNFTCENGERALQKEIRGILIEAGCYVLAPVNNTELGKDQRFQHSGKKYDFPHGGGMEGWLDGDQ